MSCFSYLFPFGCAGGEKVPGYRLTWSLCVLARYLPAIGRFLIVVTFIEDALRIITQWSDQLLYLNEFRHSMSFLYQLSKLGRELTTRLYSPIRAHSPVPHHQCHRHDCLFLYGHRSQTQRLRRRGSPGSRRPPSPRLRTHLRSELLPP